MVKKQDMKQKGKKVREIENKMGAKKKLRNN